MRCPACGRPVAVARPRCLYCGAALPAEAVSQAEAARRALSETPEVCGGAERGPSRAAGESLGVDARARAVVVIEPGRADPGDLGRALGLSAYEAHQRVRRGGWQLLRVGAPAGEGECAALRAAGARVESLSPSEISTAEQPLIVLGGRSAGERFELRTLEGPLALAPGTLLLVVRGPIARRAQVETDAARSQRRATSSDLWRHVGAHPEPGVRVHLHRRDDPRPLELDPHSFELGREAAAPAVVTLGRWLDALAAGIPIDEGFRHVTPALAPAQPELHAAAAAIDALRAGRPRTRPAPALFDNLAQFRFYSAWRAAVERRVAARVP